MRLQHHYVTLPGGASHVQTLAGAMEELHRWVDPKGYAGVSAGALVAMAHAFGKAGQIRAVLEDLLSRNRAVDMHPLAAGRAGLAAGQRIHRALADIIGPKTRLGDAQRPLCVVVTDSHSGAPVYLTSWRHPDLLACDVGATSAAMTPLFAMRWLSLPGKGTRLHFDGGHSDNNPDHVYDRLGPRVALMLDCERTHTAGQPAEWPVYEWQPVAQAKAVLRALTHAAAQRTSGRRDGQDIRLRAVGDGLDFDLSPAELTRRWDAGADGVQAHFAACAEQLGIARE